jgi:hypothetical protein
VRQELKWKLMVMGHMFQTLPNIDVIKAIPWVKEQIKTKIINLVWLMNLQAC